MRLLIRNGKPGKLPLDFEISRVALHSVGPGQPMRFEATLVNPKPIGNIQSSGYFGPFQQENPGETPVRGSYSFTHADLATFKGIGGILSSTRKIAGPAQPSSGGWRGKRARLPAGHRQSPHAAAHDLSRGRRRHQRRYLSAAGGGAAGPLAVHGKRVGRQGTGAATERCMATTSPWTWRWTGRGSRTFSSWPSAPSPQ